MSIVHITGARPNFPKAAPVMRALDALGVKQTLIHTGQHYDDRMSKVFFTELNLPTPDIDLGVGSGSHAVQTAAIMVKLEEAFLADTVDLVMVYGDVNSTVAAAMVCAKLMIPIAHVEAGLRSFDMTMPEEVNRRITDQLSDLLFVTSPDAIGHLTREGMAAERIHFVGNPMIDTLLANIDRFDAEAMRAEYSLADDYMVATLHRPANVDDPAMTKRLVQVLSEASQRAEVILPLHPRGEAKLREAGLFDLPRVRVIEPQPYTRFMGLVRGARAVLTDSGGVQEETTVLGVPCLTMRPNTERPVTITHGTNQLVALDEVVSALDQVLAAEPPAEGHPVPPLWDGKAGPRIAEITRSWLEAQG